MTIPLPHPYVSEPGTDGAERLVPQAVQGNFDAIAQQFPVGGGSIANDILRLTSQATVRKVAFGTATVGWSASTDSAVVVVAHGLGATPVIVVATGSVPTYAGTPGMNTFNYTGTNFSLNGRTGAAITQSATVSWIAIG